jgi:cytochrome c biogenesis protein CcmG/thiol:disulfide interchange protein DsbE
MKRFLIPIAVFVLLGLLLAYGLKLDPRKIPSPLVGKPLPAFALPAVADPTRTVRSEDLRGRVYLLNVWASWCAACRDEHPLLVELARARAIPIIGLNYKDQRADALKWLAALGDPYELSLSDLDGRAGIELGVYGVPETFVIDKAGVIRYKHIGPLTAEVWKTRLVPLLRELG